MTWLDRILATPCQLPSCRAKAGDACDVADATAAYDARKSFWTGASQRLLGLLREAHAPDKETT